MGYSIVDFLIAMGLIAAIPVALLVILFIAAFWKAKEEINVPFLYQEYCGLVMANEEEPGMGDYYGWRRFWRIAFYDSFLVVSSFGQTVIRYEEIIWIIDKRGRRQGGKGGEIELRLRRMGLIKNMCIRTTHSDKISKILREKTKAKYDRFPLPWYLERF
jgi:hypothetical protein